MRFSWNTCTAALLSRKILLSGFGGFGNDLWRGGGRDLFACDEPRRSYAVVIGVDVEKNSTLAGEKSNRLGVDLIDVRVRQILCLNRQFSNPSTSRYSYHGKVLNAQSQSQRAEVVREHRKNSVGRKSTPQVSTVCTSPRPPNTNLHPTPEYLETRPDNT